ncbi:MAG: DUF3373 family protein [Desulfuromonadales bacterium]|nr:DUF3373 family protein [Desulfuromonadales bacterium]
MRTLIALALAVAFMVPATAMAVDDSATLQQLQKKINELSQELDEMAARVDQTERKSVLDRINWYGDLRTKADTLHYKDVTFNPGINVDYTDFFNKVGAALNPAAPHPLGEINVFVPDALSPLGVSFDPTASQGSALDNMFVNLASTNPALFGSLMNQMGNYMLAGVAPGVGIFPMAQKRTYDINNDILYTTRLRLGMKANVADNVDFMGRLLMYKNWGDSTGSKVFDSWGSFTMDGTNGGNTTGDWLRVERAYFDWKEIGGSPLYLSIGRRPSTYGPPNQYRENELRGGTPSGHLVHFNFDGITAGYKLSEHTGIEGQTIRICYGQGFESEWGNGELFNEIDTKDVHLGGFNIDALNDGTNFLQLTLFKAWDVTDGFKGVMAFPTQYAGFFAPTLYSDMQKFPTFNFVTRVQPSTNIGDIILGGVGFSREEEFGLNWFVSGAWTQLQPNGKAGMFGGLVSDAVYEATLNEAGTEVIMGPVRATDDSTENGYSVYVGVQIPAPMGKLGLEYNYGSKYWTPFTQAQDDVIGSKLATRGHAGEAYYIVDINPNMFLKVGGIYYDYEYSNSGSPVGAPRKVEDVKDGVAFSLLPVVDRAWDGYVSMTVKF